MVVRVLAEARADLREAARYYRHVPPPALGRKLAARLLEAFGDAVRSAEAFGAFRAEHPDIPLAHFVPLPGFPYLLFYTVAKDGDVFVISVEYATSDYVDRVTRWMTGVP